MKLLVAVDGSDYSEASVALLQGLPLPRHAEVVLFTVVESAVPFDREIEDVTEAEADVLRPRGENLLDERRRLVNALAEKLQDTGWSVSVEVEHGHPADRIVAAAEALDADHIVVGSHGLTGLERFLLGSVSRAVVQHAPCSVLVVRKRDQTDGGPPPADEQPRVEAGVLRILAAFDASPSAKASIELMCSIPFRASADIAIVSVLTVATTLYGRDILERVSTAWKEHSREAQVELEAAAASLADSDARVTTELIDGGTDASTDILDFAHEWRADLIVLGSTGTSAVERFLLGSVTARVVEHAPCSVWVVRRGS
jgi:nucleotide-binding universal stress UspA family protein